MLHVRPNYQDPNLKCYYCSHNTPSKEYEETQRLYFIKSGLKLWMGYNYNEIEVHIPRCKDCFELHYPKWTATFFRLLWLLCSGLVFLGIYKAADLEPNIGVYAFVIIVSIGLGAVLSGFIAMFFENKKPKKGVKAIKDNGEYPPINRLERLGFLDFKPDPSKGSAYVNEDLSQEDIASAFNKIQAEDHCFISKS